GALRSAAARAADDSRVLGVQDVVVIAVKGPALPALAPTLAPLLSPATLIVPAMNGVPWWFVGTIHALGPPPLPRVDPAGTIAAALPLAQVIGCVVHVSASTPAPGHVVLLKGQGLIVGEVRGGESERVRDLGALLAHAGFEVTCSPRVRYDIWYKLW